MMDIRRARIIAENFSPNPVFSVHHKQKGLVIRHNGQSAYFVHESNFWPFIFRLSVVANQEKTVAEIESRLAV